MLNENSAIKLIKLKFDDMDQVFIIPLQNGGFFSARMTGEGIMVDNLGYYPFLPWDVFVEVVKFLTRNSGRADKGDGMSTRLGDAGLSLETIEGHIAHVVYGKKVGETILLRMSPISAILIWAGVCDTAQDELILH